MPATKGGPQTSEEIDDRLVELIRLTFFECRFLMPSLGGVRRLVEHAASASWSRIVGNTAIGQRRRWKKRSQTPGSGLSVPTLVRFLERRFEPTNGIVLQAGNFRMRRLTATDPFTPTRVNRHSTLFVQQ